MKNIITYCRVSTEEQKKLGFSLSNQKERLLNYIKQNKYNVVMRYEEDYSAKNFNRPQWKKLKAYCNKYHTKIDKVIFTKWDRFSRNAKEAYKEIDWFKSKDIEVYAVDNPLDFSLPESKITLAIYLTLSEIENDKISIRVKLGLKKASSEGCWTSTPPYGYVNYRNPDKKSTLIPDENANYVIDTFVLLTNDKLSSKQVWLSMREKGMIISSSQFYRLIRNPVYIGKVVMSSDKNQAPKIIEGLHTPIIPTTLFNKVQIILNKRLNKNSPRKNVNDYLYPLKGFIKCSLCNKPLTASASTGSNPNKKYYYYHCRNGCKERFSVEKANRFFYKYLDKVNIDKSQFNILKRKIKIEIQKQEKSLAHSKNKIHKEIAKLKNIIIQAEDRFFEGLIDSETFKNSKLRYLEKIQACEDKILTIKNFNPIFEFQSRTKKLKKYINLPRRYKEADFAEKRELLNLVINEKITLNQLGTINPQMFRLNIINCLQNLGYQENV